MTNAYTAKERRYINVKADLDLQVSWQSSAECSNENKIIIIIHPSTTEYGSFPASVISAASLLNLKKIRPSRPVPPNVENTKGVKCQPCSNSRTLQPFPYPMLSVNSSNGGVPLAWGRAVKHQYPNKNSSCHRLSQDHFAGLSTLTSVSFAKIYSNVLTATR